MSNPVMNYSQFMSAFKKSAAGYSGKANINNGDAKGTAKVDQELAQGPVKGSGTADLAKNTKQYLASVKNKSAVKTKGKSK